MRNETIKAYFKMHKEITAEKQFNKKVDLNVSINNFKKNHNILITGNAPINSVIIDGELTGQIIWKYAKKGNNLDCKHIGYEYILINN